MFARFLIAFFLLFTSHAQAAVFNPQSFYLPNGMRVVLVENHRVPAVIHMVWYNVGAANETPGHSGLAHFFEHLMFKGTKTVAPGEFSKLVKRMGGNDNAFTAKDYTAFFQVVPSEHLETVMKMEADRMVNLDLSDEVILTERDVIIEERKERTGNNPAAILREEVNSALFTNHPYSVPVIGWMSEIKGLSPDSARAFYKKWYAPNNAVLVVAGDITLEELKPLAEKYYGRLPPVTIPETTFPAPAPIKTEHRITYRDPRVGTPSLQFDYRAPRGSEPLQILIEAFGGHTTSPLYKSLVVKQKLAVQAGASYDPTSEDISAVTVYAVPAPGVDLGTLEAALDEEINLLLKNGLSEEDIARAKQRMVDAAIFGRDSLTAPAMIFGRALTSGFTIEDVETWPDRIAAVKPEAIAAIAKTVFAGDDKPIKSFLLPPEQPVAPPTAPEIPAESKETE